MTGKETLRAFQGYFGGIGLKRVSELLEVSEAAVKLYSCGKQELSDKRKLKMFDLLIADIESKQAAEARQVERQSHISKLAGRAAE